MAGSWVMTAIVDPSACSSSSRSSTPAPVAESRLPVGSSASTMAGRATTARAMATRCRRSAAGTPTYSSPVATLSRVVIPSMRKNCWNTKPTAPARKADRARSDSLPTSWPATRTVPAVGRSRVPITCSRVDLPDPLGPAMASSSPRATVRLTPARTSTSGGPG